MLLFKQKQLRFRGIILKALKKRIEKIGQNRKIIFFKPLFHSLLLKLVKPSSDLQNFLFKTSVSEKES